MSPALRPLPSILLAVLLATGTASAQSTGAAVTAQPARAAADDGRGTPPLARPAGMLKSVKGGVSVLRQGRALEGVAAGLVLHPGDVIRTRADGTAGITLNDDTLLACGPSSELVIEQLNFDETTHDGHLLLSLWQGTLRVASGLIAKRRPEAVQIRTRSVVLGVRGTEFIVDARGEAP